MSRFTEGQKVRLKASPERVGIIDAVHSNGGESQYDVFFSAVESRTYPEHALLGADDHGSSRDPVELLRRWQLGDADSFRSFLTLAKLTKPVADNLYSFLASRTELLPYQFKPVLKLIESPYSRMLVADEVGLGKTIEAGIILMELNARSPLRRVLIVCPSALQNKWRTELRERFEWDPEVLDGPTFRARLDESALDPEAPLRGIGSLHLLRRPENIDHLIATQPRFDAVIVDEAHHMRNHGTATNHLGEVLSGFTDTLVFLTATPLNLGEQDFFELLRVLVPEEFTDYETFASVIEPNEFLNAAVRHLRTSWPPDWLAALDQLRRVEQTGQGVRLASRPDYRDAVGRLTGAAAGTAASRETSIEVQRIITDLNALSHVFTRTRKREVSEHFPVRRAHKVAVDFTPAETRLYNELSRWVIQTYQDVPMGFILTVFQSQAGSCLPALGAKLDESLQLSEVRFSEDEVWESMDFGEGGDYDLSLEVSDSQVPAIERLAAAWRAIGDADSKYDRFEEAVRGLFEQGVDKILVFSFFIRTIDYLEERLSNLTVDGEPIEVLKLYGPTNRDDRHTVLNRFRTGTQRQVLLSSEVGSEGLDFQFCSTMFNYDLPWNPMRVEQRIGRLDRYGQEADVIQIHNMVVADTIEDRIFYRLYERIHIFEGAIGDLEAILGNELRDLQREIFRMTLTPEEQERRSIDIANAIVRRQGDHERFEEDSKKFVGNDEVFNDRFNDIREGERYITPDEVRTFVQGFLAKRFPRVRLQSVNGTTDVFALTNGSDEGFIRFLHDAYYADPSRSKLDFQQISKLHLQERFLLTFDARRAAQDRTLQFLSIHHLFVRAMVRQLEDGTDLLPTGALALPGWTGEPGFFFVFELDVRGMKNEIQFIAAVVKGDGSVDEDQSAEFLKLARHAQAAELDPAGFLNDERLRRAVSAARTWAARQVTERQQDLERIHDDMLEAKLDSLRQGFERRKLLVSRQLQEAEEERIIRMRRGQLANMEEGYERKRRELGQRRGVEVGYGMVAAGVVAE